MKQFIYIILATMLVASCQPKDENPTDVPGIKAKIAEKKTELKALETEIKDLQADLAKLEPKKEEKVVVTVEPIAMKAFNAFSTVQANVVSDEVVMASSETGGRILVMNVREGQYVKRGQMIAKVDLVSLEKQLDEIRTNLAFATTVYDRQKRLWEQEIGSEIQYLQAKNNKEQLENGIETLKTQLAKANVYAPISGVVDKEFLKAGEMAGPGAPIVQILNTSKIKVVADIPETNIQNIKKGDMVEVSLPALDITMNKKISLIGRSVDPANRTFKVEVDIDNSKGLIKPNLLAELKFNSMSKKDVITVPVDLIQEGVDGEKFVYVTKSDGATTVATKKFIDTAESFEGNIIVTEGLTIQDNIIVNGSTAVREGMQLIITNTTDK